MTYRPFYLLDSESHDDRYPTPNLKHEQEIIVFDYRTGILNEDVTKHANTSRSESSGITNGVRKAVALLGKDGWEVVTALGHRMYPGTFVLKSPLRQFMVPGIWATPLFHYRPRWGGGDTMTQLEDDPGQVAANAKFWLASKSRSYLLRPTRAFLRWLTKHHEVLNLFLVVAIAAASSWFAWNTQKISSQQTALMNRQLEIQASQSLPVFELAHSESPDPIKHHKTDWLTISNISGQIRSANLTIYSDLSFSWRERNGRSSGDEVPLIYYIQWVNPPPRSILTYEWRFGGDEELYEQAANSIRSIIEKDYGISSVDYNVFFSVEIDYMDYQANERKEYYGGGYSIDQHGKRTYELSPISSNLEDKILADRDTALRQGYVLDVTNPINRDKASRIAHQVYARAQLTNRVATPVISAPSS